MKKLFIILWLILAVICLVYGILVRMTGSGTPFFLVWIGMGFLFLLFAILVGTDIWSKMPAFIHVLFGIVLVLGLVLLCILEGLILKGFHEEGEENLDYIIVLGAQVRKDGPSPVLAYRLDRAYEYLMENPDTVCIVSGAQGYNEPCTEAEMMADYLIKRGIPGERIIQEKEATTTSQNIRYSMAYMDPDASVGIVTNNFHVYRSLCIARDQGLKKVYGIAAGSKKFYLPNNMFREFFALGKYYLGKLLPV
ncbi:MAG: YdcF family protein [Eubacterium sp.]|nr:YdcF family protein [Eubacterium sp.]